MDVTFVIPAFNIEKNIGNLVSSLQCQSDQAWDAIIIDDMSKDGTWGALGSIDDGRIRVISNSEKKYALRNIVEVGSLLPDGRIIAVIDGDDELCNPDTVSILKRAHRSDRDVVWTGHRWDINNLNISKPMPARVDPYQYEWCSSHLKSFGSTLLKGIPTSNFQDHHGNWFERGYDQALMLPLLRKANDRTYVPDVCYLYKINSCSMEQRQWSEVKQLRTVNFVRARGFLER